MAPKRSVEVRQELHDTRDGLWTACATAEELAKWQADVVEGSIRLGGTVSLIWPSLGLGVQLRVTTFVEGQRIACKAGGARLVLLVDDGSISLRHAGLRGDDEAAGMLSGWRVALAFLDRGLRLHPGKPRFVRWFFAPARAATGLAASILLTPRGFDSD